MVQTVTGEVAAGDLGFTLMHEHLVMVEPWYRLHYGHEMDFDALRARAIERMREACEAGVRTIVDLTPIDLGRDPLMMRDIARGSGMQVVAATGFYWQVPFHFQFRPTEAITALLVREIEEGIGETGVRAGVIKCATQAEMHPMNERILRASAAAQRATGVPICTHTSADHRTGLDQIRVFREEGHSDDSDDIGYLEQIIESGATCGMDRIGIPRPRSSEQRADMIAALVERGYVDRITLSHDAACYIDWFADGVIEARMPTWHHTHIVRDVLPMLRERGVSDDAIEQMTVRNPRRLFGGE